MAKMKSNAVTEIEQGAYPAEVDPQNQALLSIQDLHVWFELRKFGFGHAGFVRAVDGVNLDLAKGEAIAVVGESGCGKSSLMKTILGINRPIKGRVVFDGKDSGAVFTAGQRW
jgi:ABC-type oligopeptide transport system ATPase subunit